MEDCGPRVIPPQSNPNGFLQSGVGNSVYHYPEHGPDAPPLTGETFEALVDKIIADRAANQKPVGDPAGDIKRYVEHHWPDFTTSVSMDRSPIPKEEQGKKLRERVAAWNATRYSLRTVGHTELETEATASSRAKICASCPQNVPYEKDCAPCSQNLDRTSFLLRQGGSTGYNLQCCAIAGQNNETACFLPEKMLKHRSKHLDELKEKAPHCWMIDL